MPFDYGGKGGALATAGGLVFESNAEGVFSAYNARNGDILWSFEAQATAQGGPVSYAIDGEQYVAIAVGNGGSSFIAAGLFAPQRRTLPVGRVAVFKLGGEGSYERVDTALSPVPEPPDITLSSARLDDVATRYGAYCAGCHGFGAVSGQVTPDLRRTAYIQTREAFYAVVGDGLLETRGMPKFSEQLSPGEIEDMRAFLAGEARFLRGENETSSSTTGSGSASIGIQ